LTTKVFNHLSKYMNYVLPPCGLDIRECLFQILIFPRITFFAEHPSFPPMEDRTESVKENRELRALPRVVQSQTLLSVTRTDCGSTGNRSTRLSGEADWDEFQANRAQRRAPPPHRTPKGIPASTAGRPEQTVGYIRTCEARTAAVFFPEGSVARPVPDSI